MLTSSRLVTFVLSVIILASFNSCTNSISPGVQTSLHPTIVSVSPDTVEVGTMITIQGDGFDSAGKSTYIIFGGKRIAPDSILSHTIVFTVSDTASGSIFLIQGSDTVRWSKPVVVKAVLPLAILSLTPSTVYAGDQLSIQGSGFGTTTSDATVLIGSVSAPIVSLASNQIVVTVPPNATSAIVTVQKGTARTSDPVPLVILVDSSFILESAYHNIAWQVSNLYGGRKRLL